MIEYADTIWREAPISMIDVETTGLDPMVDRIVEIAIVVSSGGVVTDRWSALVDPGVPIPQEVSAIHGITTEMVSGAPYFHEITGAIMALVNGTLPAAYNAKFDRSFLSAEWLRLSESNVLVPDWLRAGIEWIDPLVVIRVAQRYEKSKKLKDVCDRMGIALEGAHRATADCEASTSILHALGNKKSLAMPETYGKLIERQRYHAAQNDASYQAWLQWQPKDRRTKG